MLSLLAPLFGSTMAPARALAQQLAFRQPTPLAERLLAPFSHAQPTPLALLQFCSGVSVNNPSGSATPASPEPHPTTSQHSQPTFEALASRLQHPPTPSVAAHTQSKSPPPLPGVQVDLFTQAMQRKVEQQLAQMTEANRAAALAGQQSPAHGANDLDAHQGTEEDEQEEIKNPETGEILGYKGKEPTRFGDWEFKGRCTDF